MKHLHLRLISVFSLLVTACGASDAHPRTAADHATTAIAAAQPSATATPTVFIATVTPMPTPSQAPILAWDLPPKSGVPHVDAIVSALTEGDANANAPYVTGQPMACVEYDTPYCPPGTPGGTTVQGLIQGACPGDTTPVTLLDGPPSTTSPRRYETPAEWSRRIVSTGPLYLIGIYGPRRTSSPKPYDPEPLYTITLGRGDRLARAGWVIGVDDRGIVRSIYARSDCLRLYGGYAAGQPLVAPP